MNTLGQRLRIRREELREQDPSRRADFSRVAVAQRAQIAVATLRNIEMGRHIPTPPVLAAVATVLGLRLGELLAELRLPGESVVDTALRVRQTTLGRLPRPAGEQTLDVALLRRRLSGWRPSEPGQKEVDALLRRFIELVVAAADPPPEAE